MEKQECSFDNGRLIPNSPRSSSHNREQKPNSLPGVARPHATLHAQTPPPTPPTDLILSPTPRSALTAQRQRRFLPQGLGTCLAAARNVLPSFNRVLCPPVPPPIPGREPFTDHTPQRAHGLPGAPLLPWSCPERGHRLMYRREVSPGSAGFLSHQHMLCARAWSPRSLDQQGYTAGLGLMASRPQASPLLQTALPGLSVFDPGQAPRLPPALSFPGAWRGLLPSPLLPPLRRQSHFLSVTLEHRTLTLCSRTPGSPHSVTPRSVF